MYTIEYKGHVIFDPSKESTDYALISPKYSAELNKVPSLDFSILPSHPYYNEFDRFKTGIVAKKNGVEIFRGRVVSTSIDTFKQKQVNCEGCLAYLLDTLQPKVYFEQEPTVNVLRKILQNHNELVDPEKQFTLGRVTAAKANEKINTNTTAHTQTRSLIDQYIIKQKGGYLVTRYENGVNYIDWLEKYDRRPNQKIMFGSNIIDYSEEIVTDDFFTVLLPTGKREYEEVNEKGKTEQKVDNDLTVETVNNNSMYIELPEMVAKYGKVYKTEDFGDCDDANELMTKANDYIAQYRKKLQFSLSLGVLDLHWIEGSADQLLLGDVVQVISPVHDKNLELTVTKVDFDFTNPDQDNFTFGDGIQELTKKTDSEIKKAKELANKAGSGGVSNNLRLVKNLIDITAQDMILRVEKQLDITATALKTSFKYLDLVSREWSEDFGHGKSPEEIQAQLEELGHDWDSISRGYEELYGGRLEYDEEHNILGPATDPETGEPYFIPGYISTVDFSRFMNSYVTTINQLYTYKSSDEGVMGWVATSKDLATQNSLLEETQGKIKEYIKSVGIDLDAPKSEIRLKSSAESNESIGSQIDETTRRITNAEIILNGGQQEDPNTHEMVQIPGLTFQVSQKVGADEIVSKINMSPEGVKISADMVDLGDYARVVDLDATYATIDSLDSYYMKGESITDVSNIETGTLIVEDDIQAAYVGATDGAFDGTLTVNDLVITGTVTGLDTAIDTGVHNVRLAENANGTYSLYQADRDGTETLIGTFNRAATSLTGSWSSGTFTAATSGGLTKTTSLYQVAPSDITWNGNVASFPVYADMDGDDTVKLDTGRVLRIDATHAYEQGQEDAVFEPNGSWTDGYFSIDNGSDEDIYGTELLSLADGDLTWSGTTGTLRVPARVNGGSRIYTGQEYSISSPTPTLEMTVGDFNGEYIGYPVTGVVKVNGTEVVTDTAYVYAVPQGSDSSGMVIDSDQHKISLSPTSTVTDVSITASMDSYSINNDSGLGSVLVRVRGNGELIRSNYFNFNVDKYTRANYAKAGLTQWFSGSQRELFYKYADGSGYASVGTRYWFSAPSSGFDTLYTRTPA